MSEYYGDAYSGCKPECVQNSDCDSKMACVNNKCRDPCPGVCGINAECHVQNHNPKCYCFEGYTGNPSRQCNVIETSRDSTVRPDPCDPSPCGPNSNCRQTDNHAVCSCIPGYMGNPPSCRAECVVSSECSQDKACNNYKCVNPCNGQCGTNARCQAVNHNAICSCPIGYTGDPFRQCIKEVAPTAPPQRHTPCVPSPCGPNAQCRVSGISEACSCLPNYIGKPPNCRPECTSNSECQSNLACVNQKCVDPCIGACGLNSLCNVVSHNPICSCMTGYEGNPQTQCSPIVVKDIRPCEPSPCGPNAECREHHGAGACSCVRDYQGDPYDIVKGCQPECLTNNDCDSSRTCVRSKCVNPCIGLCGNYAICTVSQHIPNCECPAGTKGDPYRQCNDIPISKC